MSGVSGDPYRDDITRARERFEELEVEVRERKAYIATARRRLGEKYERAHVPERRWPGRQRWRETSNRLALVLWLVVVGLVLGIQAVGWGFIPFVVVSLGLLLVIWMRLPQRPSSKEFEAWRYEDSVTPTHLLAERREIHQLDADLLAVEQERDEMARFLDEQDSEAQTLSK